MTETGYKEVQLGPRNFSIPEEWSTKKISEICENRDSERDPVKSSEREGGNIPYYGATGQIDSVADYLFDEKLVLIGEDGADWSDFANTAYIIEGKSWVNNHAHVLQCEEVDDEYLKEAINLMNLNYAIVGTNRGKLNKGTLMNLDILYPPLPEQRRIAEILSTVDEAIQQTDEIIETSKELKKGLMQDLLTKGIGHEEFKEVQLGPKKIEVPEEWRIHFLKDLTEEFISGGTPDTDEEKYWNGEIPWTTCAYVEGPFFDAEKDFITQEGLEESSAKILPEDGILFGTRVNVANTAKAMKDIAISQDLTGIVTGEEIYPDFLTWYLIHNKDRIAEQHSQGSTISGMIKSDVEKLKIPVPPLDEQREIAERLSVVDEKIRQEEEYREKLEELKKGLMQDLLTGEVRVKSGE